MQEHSLTFTVLCHQSNIKNIIQKYRLYVQMISMNDDVINRISRIIVKYKKEEEREQKKFSDDDGVIIYEIKRNGSEFDTCNQNETTACSRLTRMMQKFKILLAGLFISYMKMTSSLVLSPQAARYIFNFFKPNESSSSATISWDHFFNSLNQYYYNLRQELSPSQDTIYRQRCHPKGIMSQEVKGLEDMLLVIQVIAKNDEIKSCDMRSFDCTMPIPFKGMLIRILVALARLPESSSIIWQSLEAVQFLSIPITSSYQPKGVQTELEEIESRNEEYLLTHAVLELLGSTKSRIRFIFTFYYHTIFLRFHTRSYKNPAEKWEVAEACLKIFLNLIKHYEPIAEDFVGYKFELQDGESTSINATQGYYIMTQLYTNSELLHNIIYHRRSKKISRKLYSLYCLEILKRGLKIQDNYMAQLSSIPSGNKIMTGLSRVLLDKPDHMINIIKYVKYNLLQLLKQAFVAVGVIHGVTGADSELLSTFTEIPTLATNVRHLRLCRVLDKPIGNCKERILLLMMHSITRPEPNLAHYLLGFEIIKDIRKTVIEQSGILGFPRMFCLHSILGILEQSLERECDKITEARYCYTLTDFVQRHLSKLSFQGPNKSTELSCISFKDKDKIVLSQKLLMDLLHYIDLCICCIWNPRTFLLHGPWLIDIRKLHSLITEKDGYRAVLLPLNAVESKVYTRACKEKESDQGLMPNYENTFLCRDKSTVTGSSMAKFSAEFVARLAIEDDPSCEALNEIKTLVFDTVLMLLVNLRNSFMIQSDNELPSSPSSNTMMEIILSHILQWIINPGHLFAESHDASLRGLVKLPEYHRLGKIRTCRRNRFYVHQPIKHFVEQAYTRAKMFAIQVINSFGNQLMDILCHNYLGGHDVCKMLAFLLESDGLLRCILQSEPQTLRPLYWYEATMASTRLGAESLLKNKILFRRRHSFIPSVGQCYQQIFLLALYLCFVHHARRINQILTFSQANVLFLKEITYLTGIIFRSANIDMYKLVEEKLAKIDIDDYKIESWNERITNYHLYLAEIRKHEFDPHLKPGRRQDKMKDASGEICLSTIVEQLISMTNLLYTELPHIDSLIKKAQMVIDMNTAELKKYKYTILDYIFVIYTNIQIYNTYRNLILFFLRSNYCFISRIINIILILLAFDIPKWMTDKFSYKFFCHLFLLFFFLYFFHTESLHTSSHADWDVERAILGSESFRFCKISNKFLNHLFI
ncbi:hypothetical protein P5V15_003346 [Pogonomyrmex californicus]